MLGPSGCHTSTFPEIIVFCTPEGWDRQFTLLFDAGDPISLELIDPEDGRVEEEVDIAREKEWKLAVEEIKICRAG